jgi:hypothetical protein
VPLRVLSLGMSRTATSSTQQALVQLGCESSVIPARFERH